MNAYPQKEHYTADDLLAILAILRDPENGCPWDKVQPHTSIRMNCDGVCRKLIDRHPHIFGGDTSIKDWDALKNKEKGRVTLQDDLDSVPKALPALMRAAKLQKRAARGGVTVTTDPAELETLARRVEAGDNAEAALGELLFKTAALARLAGLDPEQALQKANAAFTAATHQL